jgi:hypothetical protein
MPPVFSDRVLLLSRETAIQTVLHLPRVRAAHARLPEPISREDTIVCGEDEGENAIVNMRPD